MSTQKLLNHDQLKSNSFKKIDNPLHNNKIKNESNDQTLNYNFEKANPLT